MTEHDDVSEPNEIELRESNPDEPITDEPVTGGPTMDTVESNQGPAKGSRGAGPSLVTLLLVFVVGLLIGYVSRPFTDQLAAGGQPEPSANSQESATAESPSEIALTEETTSESDSQDEEMDESAGIPVLITPTPDLSGEIAAAILPNVRHFMGDENAPVTLIEFSDFQ